MFYERENPMINLISSALICQPIKLVFKFMSTPNNDFQWRYGTLASALVADEDAERGARFRSIGHLMGNRNLSTFEVTEYEPNKKFGFKTLSGPLRSKTSYAFEMAKGCTKITISTRVSAVDLPRVRFHLLEKQLKKQLEEDLATLKNILEKS